MSRFGLQIALGETQGKDGVNKFGFNAAVGSTEEACWPRGGMINWPPSASVMKVSSTDAKDTLLGVGARTVTVFGLDANWALQSEVVELDGLEPVLTLGVYIRVFRVQVELVGAESDNAGVLYVFTGAETDGVPAVATTIYSSVEIGDNKTLQAAYSIPAGYSGNLMKLFASSFGNSAVGITVRLRVREQADVANRAFTVEEQFVLSRQSWELDHSEVPVNFPEKTDLVVTGQSSSTDGDLSAAFDIVLVANE